jgi:hypothetical protein
MGLWDLLRGDNGSGVQRYQMREALMAVTATRWPQSRRDGSGSETRTGSRSSPSKMTQ